MNVCRDDVEALKAPDVLRAYCERELGAGRRRGALAFYRCPWGTHSRLKLEVTEKNGVGLAMCRACNCGGSVLDVAAGVLGLDAKRDFAAVVEHVAEVIGYALQKDNSPRRGRSRQARRRFAPASPQEPVGGADAAKVEYLPADAKKAALEAVRRAADNPDAMARCADELELPLRDLMTHTDMELAERGMLGLSPDGHLLYVYTCHDAAGAVRVLMVKQRSWPEEVAQGKQRFYCGKGSHKQSLYGAESIGVSESVIITEGESDCLALRAALDMWLEYELHCEPDTYPPPELIPAVVAKPDAGTFRAVWAAPLRGRDVILCVDDDEAGRRGAAGTAAILKAAGACRVYAWSPAGKYKDAREAFPHCNPCELIDDLIINKIEL